MKVDLEKIKKAKGRTYTNVKDCPIPICVEDYVEYKKIEKELGIDLITLFKAQTNGFYIKNYLGINKVKLSDFKFNLIKKEVHRIVYSEHYYFKDYGKTWALTREELL